MANLHIPCILLLTQFLVLVSKTRAKVPAIIVFGDSTVDAGNNNQIPTIARSNFEPYGRDFAGGKPTGRFSNGRIPTDFISESFGLKPIIPAYLDPTSNISDFATGVTFASAGTGYDNATSSVLSVIPLWKELEYYKEYQTKLKAYLGEQKATETITEALHMTSVGTNDFLENYYSFPGRSSRYMNVQQYQDYLVGIAGNFIKELYGLGARKISLGGLPPMGCLPLERTTNFIGRNDCRENYNTVSLEFNGKLEKLTSKLNKELPGIKLVFSNPYNPLLNIIRQPSSYGFEVSSVACCATGMFEMGYACNRNDMFTCTDANKYVFWDSFHPTQKTNQNSSTSIASFGSSMNDLRLQMDFSNISLGSIDASFGSDSSHTKTAVGLSSAQTEDSSDRFQSCPNISETDLKFLSNLGQLSWESQCQVVEDVKSYLKCNDKAYHSLSSENFVEPLITFLVNARDSDDVKAQRDGIQLLLTFVSKNRNEIPHLHEDAFDLLVSFLDSEVAEEVFAILEVLSSYPFCRSKIMASGVLTSILRALNSQSRELQELVIKVLCNLSSNHEICSQIASLECIPKLVSLLSDKALVGKCLFIMKNLCNTEDARASVVETSGCIGSIAEVLDNGSSEEQEHAVDILLSLCSQRVEYCQLVMEEGIIPPLVTISINGSDRGRVSALELLRQLRDIRSEPECHACDFDARDLSNHASEKKSSKASGFFGRKISMFSKNSGKKR